MSMLPVILLILSASLSTVIWADEPLLGPVAQLTFAGRRSGEGYFDRDGQWMVFQSEREPGNPFYQIYLMDRSTGHSHRVSPGQGKTTCAWIHPDGRRVLFASTHEDPQALAKQTAALKKRAAGGAARYAWSFDEHYDIYSADLDGGHLKNLTHTPGYDAEGSWSPDGRWIVFASNRSAYTRELNEQERKWLERDPSWFMDLYLMSAEGGALRRLTHEPGYDGGPFFSPDGKRIVWRHFSQEGATAEIYTMDLTGGHRQQVTHDGVMSWAPFFHPSGDYLIYASNAQGMRNFELYMVDTQGRSKPVRVTHSDGFDGLPVFTPDGRELVWASSRTGDHQAQLFSASWNDAGARRRLGLAPSGERTPTQAALDLGDLKTHVGYLASPALEGRLTGRPGERKAGDYVARRFSQAGLHPAGSKGDWFQTFTFASGVSLGSGNELRANGQPLALERDWRPLAFSGDVSVDSAPVVFAGYGVRAPASPGQDAYDAYGETSVKGAWVLVLRDLPGDIRAERRQFLAPYSGLRYKAQLARERGARGLLVVAAPGEEAVALHFDGVAADRGFAAVSLGHRAATRILSAAGVDLAALRRPLESGKSIPARALGGVQVSARIALTRRQSSGRNVLARLESGHPRVPPLVIGAHMDHLGRGESGDSLAGRGEIHPGADDNASGVAALLEIAAHLAAEQRAGRFEPQRDVLFAAWSGEELGLLGSGAYVQYLDRQKQTVAAYLNMDMVGRLDKKLILQGVDSSPAWRAEIEQANAPLGLPVALQGDAYLSTDATSFYLRGVPILSAFTGAHGDYHRPSDIADTLNFDGLLRVTRLMERLSVSLARSTTPPAYHATERKSAPATRRNRRIYLGTIPAYGDTVSEGVRLSGVSQGGPAQQAGVRAGDVIVAMAGRPINNLYDYSNAMNALKAGQPVTLMVRRDGKPISLSLTPARRD